MNKIAHISDPHLVEEGHSQRRGIDRLRLSFLTLGARIDHYDRAERLARALRLARSFADHVVISGDLTEDGIDAQFARLATILHASD